MILALCSIVISRQISKVLSVLYACDKTTVRETLIQFTEFVNETSTKCNFIYYDATIPSVRKKFENFWDRPCSSA